jgi:hypothetical protein
MARRDRLRLVGSFERHQQALAALSEAGDAALVERGMPRMLLIRCPCECRETLVLNLDPRAGKAWRMYRRRDGLSVFPSYWRDTGCESHFVLWNDIVYWCDWDGLEKSSENSEVLRAKVLGALTDQFVPYYMLAEATGEIPWAVLVACRALVWGGLADEGGPRGRGEFRRR